MIGLFLRRRLKDLNLSYSDLARELSQRGYDVTKSAVQHWVSGKNLPPVEDRRFRVLLASALQMDANMMMMDMGYITYDTQRSPQALQAADIMDLLPEDARDLALDYLKLLGQRYGKAD